MDPRTPRKRGRRPKTAAPHAAPTTADEQLLTRLAGLVREFEWSLSDHRRDVNQKAATVLEALLVGATHEDSRRLDALVAASRKVLGVRPLTHRFVKDRMLEDVHTLLKRVNDGWSPWDAEDDERAKRWLEQRFKVIVWSCPNELVPRAGLGSIHLVRSVIDAQWPASRAELIGMSTVERNNWSVRLVNALLKEVGVQRPDAT